MLSIIATLELDMHLKIFEVRLDIVTNFPSRKLSFRVVLLCIRIQFDGSSPFTKTWRISSIMVIHSMQFHLANVSYSSLIHRVSHFFHACKRELKYVKLVTDGRGSIFLIPESIIRNYVSIDDEIFGFEDIFFLSKIYLFFSPINYRLWRKFYINNARI